ncbi:DUF58 domain-containing protein [Bacteriovorax sp. Seq25_V]|uniref:DUF58 domain-containing protein n=1 Tax=Bacteriovorax sp. Seq25_V TaxID=1201288 RepID=UPI00038A293B|nr:DUF58 domain-containing protein [Bacteriovorax sp. Seq25_V]EQC43440.1 PF01882 family protein [Bacteriovorax sp. Seq25_V]
MMNTKEIQNIVSQIKTSLFKNANSYSIGMLKSHFRGTGLKFKEHQVYSHGDDVRFIDWKMLAKTSSPYIKTFEEERNVIISIVIDCTSSMLMGYKGKSKLEASLEIVSLLYLLCASTSDYVEVIICTGDKLIRVPRKQGEAGIVALTNALRQEDVINSDGKINLSYNSKADISSVVTNDLLKEFYRRRELVLLTDFYSFLQGRDLKKLMARKHVHAFRLLTPLDYANNFNYNVKVENLQNHKASTLNISTASKELLPEEVGFQVKNLFLEKRYLEDFIKEML